MLVAPLVNQAGEYILDLAALRGKALHMAMLMDNKGTIVAADLYPHRLKLLRNDGAPGYQDCQTKLDGRMSSERCNCFDRVLLDVPCRVWSYPSQRRIKMAPKGRIFLSSGKAA